MARTWNNGKGGQCCRRPRSGDDYCGAHADGKWKAHGRVDGPIPANKLKDFLNPKPQKMQASAEQKPSIKRKRSMEAEQAIEAHFQQFQDTGSKAKELVPQPHCEGGGRGRPAKVSKVTVEFQGSPVSMTSLSKPIDAAVGADSEGTRLERAAAALRTSVLPGGLPCRDSEKEKIFTHISAAVRQGGTSQVLYISGMPGTGKTACVLEVIENVKRETPAFLFVHVNAMRLATPAAVFNEIHEKLPCGRCTNAMETRNDLQRFFAERRSPDPVILLLVDEVDLLVTPNQAVLYRLFDWLAYPRARLVFVAISNTINLPERLLPRVASRFDIVRLDFEAYSKAQIYEILRTRLEGKDALSAFHDNVLRLCSARVAAGSGDIRKALQVCRRAIEARQANTEANGPVNMPHLEAAEKDLLHANPVVQTIIGLSVKARRFLAAFALELRRKESDTVPICRVASQYRKLLIAASMESVRGCVVDAVDDPSAGYEDDARFLAKRLEAMCLLVQQLERGCRNGSGSMADSAFKLGDGLDIEDLFGALLKSEEDESIRELLDEGQSF